MIVFRRRLLFWLFKAYVRRWGKTILLSFVIGIAIFFLIRSLAPALLSHVHGNKAQVIGVVGTPTVDRMPALITEKLSEGLTTLDEQGKPQPGIAKSWKVEDDGRRYTFYLDTSKTYSDGERITSFAVDYGFTDATFERPDEATIIFKLKDSYAPFLVTVSRPLFKKGYIGVGEYKVKKIVTNNDFLKEITLISRTKDSDSVTYKFYDTPEAVKTAYALGDINHIIGLSDAELVGKNFTEFPNTEVKRIVNHTKLVTVFYNTKDPVLSDKKLRDALSYALPTTFTSGERAVSMYSPAMWVYNTALEQKIQDFEHAEALLDAAQSSGSASLTLEMKVLPKYEETAKTIAKEWEKLGITTTITAVQTPPQQFQIFLGDFAIQKDPDQYVLWHSTQPNNITHYDNKRIDKLLEDGRKTADLEAREKIYADFQRYFLDDAPVAFLYFPYEYEVTRR